MLSRDGGLHASRLSLHSSAQIYKPAMSSSSTRHDAPDSSQNNTGRTAA